jgi:putative nucleotidyltransferase with HDIG domain
MTKKSLSEKRFEKDFIQLKKLLMAMEHRVGNILEHSESVAIMAAVIARKMGFKDKKELIQIQYGAFFHDIGKISISKRILHKSASLTKHEYTIMKTHTSFGYELIRIFPSFKKISKIVLQHHECWDGSGYPCSLKGKQICIGARICAVADSFHAMSTDRKYSSKKPLPSVLRELNKCAGTKYDPEVIEALNKCVITNVKK